MSIYLNGLFAAGVNLFNDIFTRFYARQWYDVTNVVTRASLTVEDRLLIKALRIEKGWRCGSNRQLKQRTFLRTKEHMNNHFW